MIAQTKPDQQEAEAFASDLLRMASRAHALGMPDMALVLDALNDGAVSRLGLDADEPIPFTVVD